MAGIGSLADDQHRDVYFFTDEKTGLRGLTALDDIDLEPAVGVCRSRPYVEEARAIADAQRQAQTITAKALIAGLPVSGGCTTLLSNSPIGSRVAAPMPAIGRAVEKLNGHYFLMPDLQGDLRDMDKAATGTRHVLGRSADMEIDAIEATALGLLFGIEAAVRQKLARDTLMGVRIGIVGLGCVGFRLAELLRQEGARLTVADRDPRRTERAVGALGISCVATEEMIHLDLDVFAPTAAKDTIDEGMLSHLRSKTVAGAVDDPLRSPALGTAFHERGILYAPDTVINAGGLISLVQPLLPRDDARPPLLQQLQAIGSRMDEVIERGLRENRPTAVIAQLMAEKARAERSNQTAPPLAS